MEDQARITELEQTLEDAHNRYRDSENGQLLAFQEGLLKELQRRFEFLADQKYEEFSFCRKRQRGPSASNYETELYHALTQH